MVDYFDDIFSTLLCLLYLLCCVVNLTALNFCGKNSEEGKKIYTVQEPMLPIVNICQQFVHLFDKEKRCE